MHCCCPPSLVPSQEFQWLKGLAFWCEAALLWPHRDYGLLPSPSHNLWQFPLLFTLREQDRAAWWLTQRLHFQDMSKRREKKRGGEPLVRYFGFKSPILKCNCILNSSWWFDNSFIGISPFQAERGIVWIMEKSIFGFTRGSVSFSTLNV